jgi:hypothetical protein
LECAGRLAGGRGQALLRAGHLSALEAQFTNLLQQNKVRSDMGMLMEDITA